MLDRNETYCGVSHLNSLDRLMGYTLDTTRHNSVSLQKIVLEQERKDREELERAKRVKFISPSHEHIRYDNTANLEAVYNSYATKITLLFKGGEWKGKRCFVIGGGESLIDFDYSLLKGELTIGVNRVFEVFSPTVLYSMDTRFYQWLDANILDKFDGSHMKQKFADYKGYKVFLCPLSCYEFGRTDIYIVKRLLEQCISLDLDRGLYGGNNSGFGALMLAIALGANPIYLLGYDMQIENKSHWHSGYPGQNNGQLKHKLNSYKELITAFAPMIKEMGVEVVNVNTKSSLECFEFDTIENILHNEKKEVSNG